MFSHQTERRRIEMYRLHIIEVIYLHISSYKICTFSDYIMLMNVKTRSLSLSGKVLFRGKYIRDHCFIDKYMFNKYESFIVMAKNRESRDFFHFPWIQIFCQMSIKLSYDETICICRKKNTFIYLFIVWHMTAIT